MNYLIDTHILLWYYAGSDKLPPYMEYIISRKENVYVSIVSLWEIAIKMSLGKLVIDSDNYDGAGNFEEICSLCLEKGFKILDIDEEHLKFIINMPFIHKDPFDRLILAQSVVEGMYFLTRDQYLKQYPYDNIIC